MAVVVKPAFDQRAFRQALGHFPTGVCVVTATVDEWRLGMTISSFNSVSLEPPLILFSIDCRAAGLPLWERADAYAVHVLAENQKALSDRFAKRLANKWEGMSWSPGASTAPILTGAAAIFECVPHARHDAGDHRLFIAKVKCFRASIDRQPLVFSKGRYASLQPTDHAAPLWPLDIHY
jgi:flavin reductase (DIM6/NTAB) family NADH-FMN oxidoreductase RutF